METKLDLNYIRDDRIQLKYNSAEFFDSFTQNVLAFSSKFSFLTYDHIENHSRDKFMEGDGILYKS